MELMTNPWPWWISGPLIGIMVPVLLVVGGKAFGISSSLRHVCAATLPGRIEYLRYDWRKIGGWNLMFAAGIVLGGLIAGGVFANPDPVAISAATRADILALGIQDQSGLVPPALFSWSALLTFRGGGARGRRLPARLRCAVHGGVYVRARHHGPRGAAKDLARRGDRLLRWWVVRDPPGPSRPVLRGRP